MCDSSQAGCVFCRTFAKANLTFFEHCSLLGIPYEGKLQDRTHSAGASCNIEKCFGGCFFNMLACRVGKSGGKIVKCDSEVLTEEYNTKVDEQKRCFPIVALVIVSE